MRRIEDFERFVAEDKGGNVKAGEVLTRDDFSSWLSAQGYAPRTINNMLYPSRDDGLISKLIAYGVLSPAGIKRWSFNGDESVDNAKRAAKEKNSTKKERVVFYTGQPNEAAGWTTHNNLADPDYGSEWSFSVEEFRDGDYNLKVFCVGRYPRKANYWMSFIGGKLSGRDYNLFKEIHPKLVKNLIEDIGDPMFVASA